jgi:hypothetical protein
VRAAAAATGGVQWGKWALLTLGLIATVAVTVYITRLASRALKERPELTERAGEGGAEAEAIGSASESAQGEGGAASSDSAAADAGPPQAAAAWRGAIVAGVIGGVLLLGGITAQVYAKSIQNMLGGLFGPPAVTMTEAYEANPDGPEFDHAAWNNILSKHVDDAGFVDYAAIKRNPEPLEQYIAAIDQAPFKQMGRDEKLALLINAYNAFTIQLILDNYQTAKNAENGIRAIDDPWTGRTWSVGENEWTLDEIEHEVIRPNFKEPRIHWALVCAAYSCPPLRNEAYTAENLEQQLTAQAKYVHNHPRWYRYDASNHTVHLTAIYDWYAGDFEQTSGSVLKAVGQHAPAVKRALDNGNPPRIEWIKYKWNLNDKSNRSMLNGG